MSIILDIEMPESCIDCPLCFKKVGCLANPPLYDEEKRPEKCPILGEYDETK